MADVELDFSAYIAERTCAFTGRERVLAGIDRWLAEPHGHFFTGALGSADERR